MIYHKKNFKFKIERLLLYVDHGLEKEDVSNVLNDCV